ncbi:trypsin-like peptidase domain-containing protein, partial [Nonomuraea maheshkhaliensis]|uniref:trypsin-like peptidase domain-containing protein n=1 Tax=Nonomuraea maheshkhaliensis TaxID=419590 RepID=UPI0031F937E6
MTSLPAVEFSRLVDVRAGGEKIASKGSGYLISPTLILTARHVVVDSATDEQAWPRIEVRVGDPAQRSGGRAERATCAWISADPDVDAALLRLEERRSIPPARWGVITGAAPGIACTAIGFPRFALHRGEHGGQSEGGKQGLRRQTDQLQGQLHPGDLRGSGRYVVRLDAHAAPEQVGDVVQWWSGMSGGALMCAGLLTGVIAFDDTLFRGGRLRALPSERLLACPEFTRLITDDTGIAPVLEAVEFAGLFRDPTERPVIRTLGDLLRAEVAAVPFHGRATETAELAIWRARPAALAVRLVHGEGGHGKTRLAREFVERSRRKGWLAGFFDPRLPPEKRAVTALGHSDRPVLLVIDYAETDPAVVQKLIDIIVVQRRNRQPLRLLLLARTAGQWWKALAAGLTKAGCSPDEPIRLAALTPPGRGRRERDFTDAARSLARLATLLPDLPAADWTAIAGTLPLPDLDDPRFGKALNLQMEALLALLEQRDPGTVVPGLSSEERFYRRHIEYLDKVARRRGLDKQGILSDDPDDSIRPLLASQARQRSLGGLILLGPCDPATATNLGELACSAGTAQNAPFVTGWLADLYPQTQPAPDHPGQDEEMEPSLGQVQPDPLAELMISEILREQPDLFDPRPASQSGGAPQLGTLTSPLPGSEKVLINETARAYQALTLLARAAVNHEHVAAHVRDLIHLHPTTFGAAAPWVALVTEWRRPLLEGFIALARTNAAVFDEHITPVLNALPRQSVQWAYTSSLMSDLSVEIYRELAELNRDAYLPDLAMSLNNHAIRLAEVGRRAEAVPVSEEAVRLRRELAELNRDAYLPDLAGSLNNHANRLAEVGRRTEAVP